MTARRVHFHLDEDVYERAQQAAEADRRSLSNWLSVLVERALKEAHKPDEQPAS